MAYLGFGQAEPVMVGETMEIPVEIRPEERAGIRGPAAGPIELGKRLRDHAFDLGQLPLEGQLEERVADITVLGRFSGGTRSRVDFEPQFGAAEEDRFSLDGDTDVSRANNKPAPPFVASAMVLPRLTGPNRRPGRRLR